MAVNQAFIEQSNNNNMEGFVPNDQGTVQNIE